MRPPDRQVPDEGDPPEGPDSEDFDAAAANRPQATVTPRLPGPLATAVIGYRRSRPAERSCFWIASSVAVTIATSRTINYVRERNRPMPRTRSVLRQLAEARKSDSIRVHHDLPGIGLGFASGAVAILGGANGPAGWCAVPYGVGLGLTSDEIRSLAGRNNPYWGGQRSSFIQGGVAGTVALAFIATFLRRGHQQDTPG